MHSHSIALVFRVAAVAASAIIFVGCPATPDRIRHTLEHDGRERGYLLYVPPALPPDQTVPLILALHPFAGTGDSFAITTGFDLIAREEGFIVCYPEGVSFLWNGDPTDESGKQLLVEDADDVGFIGALLDHLLAEYPIDPARVYVCGASNGGLMAQRLACELSDRFAAAASVMITLPEGFDNACAPESPIPMLILFGTEDPFFPWEGGAVQQGPANARTYLSAREAIGYWVESNRAVSPPNIMLWPDADPNDGTRVLVERYRAGQDGAPVHFYRIHGGGHTWPGSAPSWIETPAGVGRTSRDIDASRAIWEFFALHSR
ncbi:MAG: prolyl oligopeptidase family serine peptidase [Candidatus Hydrogenedentes bacterium]|nr:prolyl oligopeptidase family serine peptidase [Candidatus Hydrogenedentota bacterium]